MSLYTLICVFIAANGPGMVKSHPLTDSELKAFEIKITQIDDGEALADLSKLEAFNDYRMNRFRNHACKLIFGGKVKSSWIEAKGGSYENL